MKVFSGTASKQLTKKICDKLGIQEGKSEIRQFNSGEFYCRFEENIRQRDIFLVQCLNKPANDNLMELLVFLDAARRASAKSVTVVIPMMGYARQDRKTKAREPISARLVLDLLGAAGADRIISIDLHNSASQGFSNLPFDNLYASAVFLPYFKEHLNDGEWMFVAPDVGTVKRVSSYCRITGAEMALLTKTRISADRVETSNFIGDVKDKKCVLVDDLTESCGTLINAANLLKEQGAEVVVAMVSHSALSEVGYKRLTNAKNLSQIITTNTIDGISHGKIKVLDISPLLGEAIERTYNGKSLSALFQIEGY